MNSKKNSITETNHFISLQQAINMTSLYRAEKENILIPELRNQNILLICETFDRSAFDTLLAEEGCVGVRLYFGMQPNLQVRVIAVGVNDRNEDILPDQVALAADGDGGKVIVEEGQPCPELCPPDSPLNG